MKAIILFMSSSGTAKAETLSLTVQNFIDGTKEYHENNGLKNILNTLEKQKNIIPTLYLKRIKTNKYYYTFCSPETSTEIIKYLKSRKSLKINDKLFNITPNVLLTRFQNINDTLNWGTKGYFRFFRAHTLRKFHASNLGLHAEYIDELQGRRKNNIHERYIKTNPQSLKKIYMKYMKNVQISNETLEKHIPLKKEFPTIIINMNINIFTEKKSS